MCTYLTERVELTGSGKGREGWFKLREASVYFDHPVHALAEHTLNIDFRDPAGGPTARVAVELDAQSALDLVDAILSALNAVPAAMDPAAGQGWTRATMKSLVNAP
jgi:hypothetical protein